MIRHVGDRGAISTGGGPSAWTQKPSETEPKPGRRRTTTLTVSLKLKLDEALREKCSELDVPLSEWVAEAIEERLERDKA